MDLDSLTGGEKVAIIGGVLTAICAFLPWVSAGPFSVSGIDMNGTFTLLFGAGGVCIVLFRDWETVDIVGVGVLGILTVLIGGNVYNNLGGMTGQNVMSVSADLGLHLTMLGGLLLIGAAVYSYTQSGSGQQRQPAGGY